MNDERAYIINAAPGAGKSTLLKNLHKILPDGFALLDGDDVGRVTPFQKNIDWLNVVQDNLASCCANFRRYGFTNCVIGFVFPDESRLERMKNLLRANGFKAVCHSILDCGDGELRERISRRNTSKMINIERAVELNGELKHLVADFRIDTTDLTADDVAKKAAAYLLREGF